MYRLVCILLVCLAGLAAAAKIGDPINASNCTSVTKSATKPSGYFPGNTTIMLMGGGYTVEDSLGCLLNSMSRQRLPIITVLRSHGDDEYNDAFYMPGTTKSVSTFIVSSRIGAASDFVNKWLQQSTLVFFSGGDQGEYWNFWHDTPLQDTVNRLISQGSLNQAQNPFSVGGTSAGLAIQGEYMFAALNDSIETPDVLANPYDPKVTITKELLSNAILKGVITDTHFRQRDRMGRLMGFMARIMKDNGLQSFRGFAANERSCVDVYPNGIGEMTKHIHDPLNGSYFFQMRASPMDVIAPGKPLTLGNAIQVMKLTEGQSFDLVNWDFMPGAPGVAYSLFVKNGQLFVNGNGGSIY